jgi:hypothetical protein
MESFVPIEPGGGGGRVRGVGEGQGAQGGVNNGEETAEEGVYIVIHSGDFYYFLAIYWET